MYTLHLITQQVESIKVDLTEKKDKTAEILKTIKQLQKNITELRDNYNSEKRKEENEQQKYFDEIIIEFAPDNSFSNGIHRHLKGISMDMKDIHNYVNTERRMANKNEEYMHARITLIDYDCEDLPDSMKLED
jgi:chromosome segregation ATPase